MCSLFISKTKSGKILTGPSHFPYLCTVFQLIRTDQHQPSVSWQTLGHPNAIKIIADRTIRAEEARTDGVENRLAHPGLLISVLSKNLRLNIHVATEVRKSHEAIVVEQIVREVLEGLRVAIGECAGVDHVDRALEILVLLVEVAWRVVPLQLLHLIDGHAEEEEVLRTNALADLNVRAIKRANSECAVESELHVGRARSLLAGEGNLLVEIGGWDDELSVGDVVVLNEHNVHATFKRGIVVHHASNIVDQLDGQLGHCVAWSRLCAEHEGAWRVIVKLDLARLQSVVISDDLQDLHRLALVLVQTLDHGVEHRVWIDIDALVLLHPVGEGDLVIVTDLRELVDELRVIRILLKLRHAIKIGEPIIVTAQLGAVQCRQLWVGEREESAWGDAVGHVGELAWEDVGVVLEH